MSFPSTGIPAPGLRKRLLTPFVPANSFIWGEAPRSLISAAQTRLCAAHQSSALKAIRGAGQRCQALQCSKISESASDPEIPSLKPLRGFARTPLFSQGLIFPPRNSQRGATSPKIYFRSGQFADFSSCVLNFAEHPGSVRSFGCFFLAFWLFLTPLISSLPPAGGCCGVREAAPKRVPGAQIFP